MLLGEWRLGVSDGMAAAIVAAIPATIAAAAAWRAAHKTERKVSTSNGHTVGQMVEATHSRVEALSENQQIMAKGLTDHLNDSWAHRQ